MSASSRPAQILDFNSMPPSATEGDSKHWIVRAANFIVVTTEAKAGDVMVRENDPDEHFVLLPEGLAAAVSAGGESIRSQGDALLVVPPGRSRIELGSDGFIHRIFTTRSTDLLAKAVNREAYAGGAPDVVPLEPWPMPVDGYRLRLYSLADYVQPDINMRLFRTRCLMVNAFTRQYQPRDIRKMTPHSHADFEQGALVIDGQHVHHLRYPWTADMRAWRQDEHLPASACSFTLIPPNVVHTTQAIDERSSRLLEIFAPPRKDFSLIAGRVCNADEYPMSAGS